jgi:hypothetical protein
MKEGIEGQFKEAMTRIPAGQMLCCGLGCHGVTGLRGTGNVILKNDQPHFPQGFQIASADHNGHLPPGSPGPLVKSPNHETVRNSLITTSQQLLFHLAERYHTQTLGFFLEDQKLTATAYLVYAAVLVTLNG